MNKFYNRIILTLIAVCFLILSGCRKKEGNGDSDSVEVTSTNETPVEEVQSITPPVVKGVAPEQVFATVCAACHGMKGEGNLALHSPSIAGLPSWYILEQIGKFRNGFRGSNPEDIPGTQMMAISMSLTGEQIQSAAIAVERLPSTPTRIIKEGDNDRGREMFAQTCMPCHRFNGQGEQAFHSAPLVTLNPEYLRRQLQNYAKGWRGSAEQDFYGHKMVQVSSGLSDRDITDLVRFIGELAHGDDPRRAMNW